MVPFCSFRCYNNHYNIFNGHRQNGFGESIPFGILSGSYLSDIMRICHSRLHALASIYLDTAVIRHDSRRLYRFDMWRRKKHACYDYGT